MKGMPWAKYSVGIHAHGLRLVAFLVSDILFSMFPELRVRTVACGVGKGFVYWCWIVSIIAPYILADYYSVVWQFGHRRDCAIDVLRPICIVISVATSFAVSH